MLLTFTSASSIFASSIRRHLAQPLKASYAPRGRSSASVAPAVRMQSRPSCVPIDPFVDVFIVPVLSDNFAYLIHDKQAGVAAVVDPVAPKVLIDLASSVGATITTALVTHRHWDHAGGNEELAKLVPDVEIVGSAYEPAPAVSIRLEHHASRVVKGGLLAYRALHTPCHTQGHLCFVTDHTATAALFCGDTLFVAGCGRFFEGSAADMHRSLNTTIASLPDECLVFCGHEYTVANLQFALSVEPDNAVLQQKLEWAKARRANNEHTVPSTVGEEKQYNPFMRPHMPGIAAAVGMPGAPAEEVMAALRVRKNNF